MTFNFPFCNVDAYRRKVRLDLGLEGLLELINREKVKSTFFMNLY